MRVAAHTVNRVGGIKNNNPPVPMQGADPCPLLNAVRLIYADSVVQIGVSKLYGDCTQAYNRAGGRPGNRLRAVYKRCA